MDADGDLLSEAMDAVLDLISEDDDHKTIEAIKKYFDAGGRVDDSVPKENFTLLHYAVIHNRPQVAKYLLSAGASVDEYDYWSNKPLMVTTKYFGVNARESREIIGVLLDAGAEVDDVNEDGDCYITSGDFDDEFLEWLLSRRDVLKSVNPPSKFGNYLHPHVAAAIRKALQS